MKKMKMYLMTAILGVASLSMVFTSCNTDECKDVVCVNSGVCNPDNGNCDCPTGYEGETCEILSRAKFINSAGWLADETGSNSGAVPDFDVEIKANTINDNAVYIENVWDYFSADVDATIDGNVISIPRQEPDSDGFYVEGSGTINTTVTPNVITIDYKVTDETIPATIVTDDVNGTWTQK